jgi:hypothetical protein
MNNLYFDSAGLLPEIYTSSVDDQNPASPPWVGMGKPCFHIPASALDHLDNISYLTTQDDLDDVGRHTGIEWANTPDWERHEEHWRSRILLFANRRLPAECEPSLVLQHVTPGGHRVCEQWG